MTSHLMLLQELCGVEIVTALWAVVVHGNVVGDVFMFMLKVKPSFASIADMVFAGVVQMRKHRCLVGKDMFAALAPQVTSTISEMHEQGITSVEEAPAQIAIVILAVEGDVRTNFDIVLRGGSAMIGQGLHSGEVTVAGTAVDGSAALAWQGNQELWTLIRRCNRQARERSTCTRRARRQSRTKKWSYTGRNRSRSHTRIRRCTRRNRKWSCTGRTRRSIHARNRRCTIRSRRPIHARRRMHTRGTRMRRPRHTRE